MRRPVQSASLVSPRSKVSYNVALVNEATPNTATLWCVVANVADETHVGPAGAIVRRGTKHFSPGTKVYCFPPLWGDGYERVRVLGRHRGARGLVEMIVPFRHLTNWRAKLVYDPFVVSVMKGHWDDSKEAKARAETIAFWGMAARNCEYCKIEHRNRDLSTWWIFRTWPALAFSSGAATQPPEIHVVSRVHCAEPENLIPCFRANFAAALDRIAAVAQQAFSAALAVTPVRDENGHLHAVIRTPTCECH